jgi:hypothetical protein
MIGRNGHAGLHSFRPRTGEVMSPLMPFWPFNHLMPQIDPVYALPAAGGRHPRYPAAMIHDLVTSFRVAFAAVAGSELLVRIRAWLRAPMT